MEGCIGSVWSSLEQHFPTLPNSLSGRRSSWWVRMSVSLPRVETQIRIAVDGTVRYLTEVVPTARVSKLFGCPKEMAARRGMAGSGRNRGGSCGG